MFTKVENKRTIKAEKLWNNICAYLPDSAKQVSKRYDYDRERIISNLESFPQVTSYSGHRSGKKGSGVNQSAMKVLTDAIEYLNDKSKQNVNDSDSLEFSPNPGRRV